MYDELFCVVFRHEGLRLITGIFCYSELPLSIANSVIGLACNVKIWLNPSNISELFFPLRSAVLKYLCNLNDKEHKTSRFRKLVFIYVMQLFIVSFFFFLYMRKKI